MDQMLEHHRMVCQRWGEWNHMCPVAWFTVEVGAIDINIFLRVSNIFQLTQAQKELIYIASSNRYAPFKTPAA